MPLEAICSGQDPESAYYRRLLCILVGTVTAFLALEAMTVLGCELINGLGQLGSLSEGSVGSLVSAIFRTGHGAAVVVLVWAVSDCLLAMMKVVRQRPVCDLLFEERMVGL